MLFSRLMQKNTFSNHQRTNNETISFIKGHKQPIYVRLAKAGDNGQFQKSFQHYQVCFWIYIRSRFVPVFVFPIFGWITLKNVLWIKPNGGTPIQ
jgi:hypothetical protein